VPDRTSTADALGALERACFAPANPQGPLTVTRVAATLNAAQSRFDAGDYPRAGGCGADAVAGAEGLAAQSADTPEVHVLLAQAYALATEVLVKIGGAGIAAITADRAVNAARTSGSPLAIAIATRQLASVMRHAGRKDSAARLALAAAEHLRRNGTGDPDEIAVYTRILCTSAYTAATAGNRGLALDLIAEADHAAAEAIRPGSQRFDAAAVTVYRIGVHYALGDAGAAVATCARVRPSQLPTPERRARYWADVARAESLYGRPDRTYRALQAAWREAPGEVRDRRSMRNLVSSLLPHDRRLPGLQSFAARVGALT
jgi:hypothetical protein